MGRIGYPLPVKPTPCPNGLVPAGITYVIWIRPIRDHLVDPKKEAYWGSPDFYIGGAEHAVLHSTLCTVLAPFFTRRGSAAKPRALQKTFPPGSDSRGRR